MQAQADVTAVKKSTGLKGKDVIIEYYNVSQPVPAACNLHGVILLHQPVAELARDEKLR